jgi:predicted AlkP superfamily phosphohydrolase/phosphomutase
MEKVLMIGLDGATFDLILPWAASGKLPYFAHLLKEGVWGKLRSTTPPMSPPAWNSFMTGKNPGKHGIFDFTERKPQNYEARFINATWRNGETFWQLLSEAGKRVAVLSVPFTYPPEKVNGAMISGFDAPGVAGLADRSATYPPELYDEIRVKVGDYPMAPNLFACADPAGMLALSLETMEKKAAAALYLYQREAWDCFIFVLGETDGAAHRFWRFCDPASPLRDGTPPEAVANAILAIYQKADEVIGRFLKVMPKGTTLFLLSDHGNGGDGDTAVYPNRWLEKEGMLRFKHLNQYVTRTLNWGKRIGLKVLSPQMKRRVYRWTNLPNQVESWVRFSAIDWRRTVAYSEETPYFPSVWINLKGREPLGIVEERDYDALCERLRERLAAWRNPYTSEKMIRHVYRREEVYSGPQVAKAPDLVLDWNLDHGYSYLFRPSTGSKYPPVSKLNQKEKQQVKSGDHREEGIFLAAGPRLKTPAEIKGADIVDLAPTLLHLLGLPIPSEMDGKVLSSILDEGYLASHPVRQVRGEISGEGGKGRPRDYSEEEVDAVKARLQGLGYMD